jgi:bifunctional N-acetylglucosamine-1-phosphate-uridyltransferase/glucosamine-1-phosphate-acetyltransferase GlmU-like protein
VRWGSKANLGRRLDPSKRSLDERSDIRVWFFAARMRPGTSLGEGVRIGNFVETTAAVVEVGVKVNHLSYVGDAHAGAITGNYDGFSKHKTLIGDGAFVGTNSSPGGPGEDRQGGLYRGSGSGHHQGRAR